jgi:hypothetical protein
MRQGDEAGTREMKQGRGKRFVLPLHLARVMLIQIAGFADGVYRPSRP